MRARTARPEDLADVLALVAQHDTESTVERVLSGRGGVPPAVAAEGFRRLLADRSHRVVLAVSPGPDGETAVGLAVLGLDALSVVLGSPQVTVDTFVVHRDHRRRGVGVVLLAAAAEHARDNGAEHVVAAVGGHEPERQRFLSRMGFAPLSTRRIAGLEPLSRQLAAWQRSWVTIPPPRSVSRSPRRSLLR